MEPVTEPITLAVEPIEARFAAFGAPFWMVLACLRTIFVRMHVDGALSKP